MKLQAQTNSENDIPEFGLVDPSELNELIARYSEIFDFHSHPSVMDLRTYEDPSIEFVDEDGESCDDEFSHWSPSTTIIGQNCVQIVFTNKNDGTELFFEYRKAA
ncbi:hypothetical protein [Alteromonas gilva]|uniref:Uncharacterized protein n=1 Tax=Alteromonas gilva TaxID=2987522 RepID=A0ABT5L7I8_9ALTE|nr:hypothetical protein [Alteromonas gilva]MDC8832832.1 hypothetical protein [Alteromonas gilva]